MIAVASPESLVLAAVMGTAFGGLVWHLWRIEPSRLALGLLLLWLTASLSQQVMRQLQSDGFSTREIEVTAGLRLVFGAVAVLTVWGLGRWQLRRLA